MEGIISQPTNNSLRSGAIWATKETSLPKKRNLPSPTSQIPHGIGMGCFSSEISSELSSFYPVLGVQLGGVVQLWVGHGKFAPHQATPFPRGVGFPGSFEGFRGCRNWWNIVAFTGRYDWISMKIPWKKVKKWITVGVAAVFTPPFPHQHLTQGPVCFAQNFAEPPKDWILRKNTPRNIHSLDIQANTSWGVWMVCFWSQTEPQFRCPWMSRVISNVQILWKWHSILLMG